MGSSYSDPLLYQPFSRTAKSEWIPRGASPLFVLSDPRDLPTTQSDSGQDAGTSLTISTSSESAIHSLRPMIGNRLKSFCAPFASSNEVRTSDSSNASLTCLSNASAITGGTAFPTCLLCFPNIPANWWCSGNVWMQASSRTVNLRRKLGWTS